MLDIINYRNHPENKDFIVFHFRNKEQSEFFEELLIHNELFFEKHLKDEQNFMMLFATRKKDFSQVSQINDHTKQKFRRPFISDDYLRYLVLFLFFLFVGLAFTGFIITSLD